MALLVGQLLFAARIGNNVQVDLVVLERADVPASPPVGAPISFEFALPGDAIWREAMACLLRTWADELAVVKVDVLERGGRTLVRVVADDATLTLEQPA